MRWSIHFDREDRADRVDPEAERQASLAVDPDARRSPRIFPRGALLLVALGGACVAAFGLAAIQSIVAPVFLALVLTICVHPLRIWLELHGMPRGAATISVITAVFLLLAGFVTALVLAFAQFATLLPGFAPQFEAAGDQISTWLSGLGIGADQIHAVKAGFDPHAILAFATGLLGNVSSITVGLVVVLTCLLLMASDASSLGTVFRQLMPEHERAVVALQSFAHGVRKYMVATTALGIAQGILNALALLVLGVPGAFLWGLLAFLCSFIPNVGYFVAIIPPMVFGFLVGGLPTMIWVVVVYGVINAVVQSIIQPRVVGNAVALGQTITFVSVLFWAVIIGPIGAILAIPLTLLVRLVLVDTDPRARWWRPLLGDLASARTEMKAEDLARHDTKERGRSSE